MVIKRDEAIMRIFIRLLQANNYISVPQLIEGLGISERTAFRYLTSISLVVPLECKRGRNGGYRLMPRWRKKLKERIIVTEKD